MDSAENLKYKEVEPGVFENQDPSALAKYRKQKRAFGKVDEITDDINSLKSELTEIKKALQFLIEKN